MKRILSTVFAFGLLATAAQAQPSEYYVWRHMSNGQTLCDPESPGKEWTKVSGPYGDSHCKFLLPK